MTAPAVVRVADRAGTVLEPAWLPRAERVHRQLRPDLSTDYVSQMTGIFREGGEMAVAVLDGEVAGVAVFRCFANTHVGRRFYVDDLVTDDLQRSTGVGHALLSWLEQEARARGAGNIDLESGTQRTRAHRFYFREGYFVTSFSFRKALG
jgi:GNAT superfamily N-acetyltransferase